MGKAKENDKEPAAKQKINMFHLAMGGGDSGGGGGMLGSLMGGSSSGGDSTIDGQSDNLINGSESGGYLNAPTATGLPTNNSANMDAILSKLKEPGWVDQWMSKGGAGISYQNQLGQLLQQMMATQGRQNVVSAQGEQERKSLQLQGDIQAKRDQALAALAKDKDLRDNTIKIANSMNVPIGNENDLADFATQMYHPTVMNALASTGVDQSKLAGQRQIADTQLAAFQSPQGKQAIGAGALAAQELPLAKLYEATPKLGPLETAKSSWPGVIDISLHGATPGATSTTQQKLGPDGQVLMADKTITKPSYNNGGGFISQPITETDDDKTSFIQSGTPTGTIGSNQQQQGAPMPQAKPYNPVPLNYLFNQPTTNATQSPNIGAPTATGTPQFPQQQPFNGLTNAELMQLLQSIRR